MVMKLDKEKLVPLLEMMGYTTIGDTNVWKKAHEDLTQFVFWGVDFNENEVFRWVEDHREYDVNGDSTFDELMNLVESQCGKPEKEVEATPSKAFADDSSEEKHSTNNNVPEKDKTIDSECEVVDPEELTPEERLKVAEMVADSGYDKETAIDIVKGRTSNPTNMPAEIPQGYVPQLSISDVKMYLCPMATDQEAYVFLELCKARNLNPFTNEVYLIKYNQKDKAQAVVGKETFTRKAEQNKFFSGFEAGIILLDEQGNLVRREGTFYIEGEKIVGGWAKVHRTDKKHPFTDEVALSEYIQVTKEGEPNKFWRTKPGTMIRKVALCHALREAFPSEFGGLYDQSEMGASA